MKLTRRQLLGSAAALSAAAAASRLGYQHLQRRPSVHINRIGLPFGHQLRNGQVPLEPQSEHRCHTLILGSGAAALSAAWYLAKHGQNNFLLAEGIERNGNNAAYVSGSLSAPSAAHYLALPSLESIYVRQLLADLGILLSGIGEPEPVYRETDLVYAPTERLLYQKRWQYSLLPQEDADSRRFHALVERLRTARGRDGLKIFTIPVALSSADEEWRRLDQLTFAAWLKQENYRSPGLLWYLDYCCRDDYGQGIEQVSAFAGLHYFTARGHTNEAVLTWPDGLAHLSEAIRHHIRLQTIERLPENPELAFPQPTALDATALQISETGEDVAVILRHNQSGHTALIRAQHVICAMPLMVAARIIAQPQRYGFSLNLPAYAPWLVSNFVLHSFPKEAQHSELAWDNVVYGSRGLGYVVSTNQLIRTAKPERSIFTAYTALNHDSPSEIRRWLLKAGEEELLEHAAQDLIQAYGPGFWQHVSAVDIGVRGHGMSVPTPGYLTQETLLQLRQHRSRLLFAHSDLSSYSVMEEAVYWGVEAAKKILPR
ncbi:twin-arginine translocation pathway signal [Eikenella longinqua]|uniref:Twin-arginine translocation pathway signal n=1 Tax=Eikenella longinqua TaxID=1795827 RepID=A0A1A9RX05_9NEIS|nr:FAD-dependent oxidoreductase [Eikenella longinqua]OAM27715.1 twin-arginine translocation pathway signal [Eikenella longinqua]